MPLIHFPGKISTSPAIKSQSQTVQDDELWLEQWLFWGSLCLDIKSSICFYTVKMTNKYYEDYVWGKNISSLVIPATMERKWGRFRKLASAPLILRYCFEASPSNMALTFGGDSGKAWHCNLGSRLKSSLWTGESWSVDSMHREK